MYCLLFQNCYGQKQLTHTEITLYKGIHEYSTPFIRPTLESLVMVN